MNNLKSQALRGLIGASGGIQFDVVARWDGREAQVGSFRVKSSEYRRIVQLAGRHDEAGYTATAALLDEVLGRIGILCLAGVPEHRRLYLRPKPTRLRLQDTHGRHTAMVDAWIGHHFDGLCLHFGGAGPHFPIDGPGAATFLRSLHNAATGITPAVELWDGKTLERGQANVLCNFLDGIGLHVSA